MRAKENFCRSILDTRAIVSRPWSRIQLPDAPFRHHNVPSSEDWAKEMLDIWKVNWLCSMRRELEQARHCAFVLVWINSKPCYLCQTGSAGGSGGGNRKPFQIIGDRQCCMCLWLSLFVDCTNEPFQNKPKLHCKWESVFPIWYLVL